MTMPDTPELPPTDLPPLPHPCYPVGTGRTLVAFAAWQMHVYARAAILADRATRLAAAPKGWKLVPVEPTDEMLEAGRQAGDFHILHYDGVDKPGTPRYSLQQSYAAMLDAAPAASSPEAADERTDMCSVTREDANNYCAILSALGMEEEGDPVAEVKRLIAFEDDTNEAAALASAPAGAEEARNELVASMFHIAMYGDRGDAKGLRKRIADTLAALAGAPAVAAQLAPAQKKVIDANELERMAKERPNECFLRGTGVLKLTGAIRQLERQLRAAVAADEGRDNPLRDALGSILDITNEEHFIRGADSKLYEIRSIARLALKEQRNG